MFQALDGPQAVLSVEGNGLERRLEMDYAGKRQLIGVIRAEYLSDEGVSGGKRFTGALLGLAALGKGKAVFSGFRVQWTGM